MPRPTAPSMPTPHQIQEAQKAVADLYPGARIVRVGPEGVTFEYPDTHAQGSHWAGKAFSGDPA